MYCAFCQVLRDAGGLEYAANVNIVRQRDVADGFIYVSTSAL